MPKAFTLDDIKPWAEEYKNNPSFVYVANKFNVDRYTVRKCFKKYKDELGINIVKDTKEITIEDIKAWAEKYKEVLSFRAVARDFNVNLNTVINNLHLHKEEFGLIFKEELDAKDRTMEEISKWADEYKITQSLAKVVKKFNVPHCAVNRLLHEHKDELGIVFITEERERLALEGKKKCNGECGQIKSLEEFGYLGEGQYRSTCKVCQRKYENELRAKNKRPLTEEEKRHNREVRSARKAKMTPEELRIRQEKRTAAQRKRRASYIGVEENFTVEDKNLIFEVFGGKCFKCKKDHGLSVDHHKPLNAGFALNIENAVILCIGCNSSKHDKMPEEFYTDKELSEINELFKKAKLLKEQKQNVN